LGKNVNNSVLAEAKIADILVFLSAISANQDADPVLLSSKRK